MSRIWAERLTALGMIAFAVIFLAQSTAFPGTSGTFPVFTQSVIILLAVIMIIRSFFTKDERFEGDVKFDFSYMGVKPVYVMAVAIAYGWAIFNVGFYVTSFVFYFLVTWMTGYRNMKVMAAVAVVLFPLMYVFFSIALDANLPTGILF
ncbi:MAG: tripartite tricarboxylate transporter TctB family protein [Alphaproteobacteria bacterium]|nr:tripartite tricarboxylate transporter TctB family protein [Alphaproteobacteria bacterium]